MPWTFMGRVRASSISCVDSSQFSPFKILRSGLIARFCPLFLFLGLGCSVLQAQTNASSGGQNAPTQAGGAFDKDIVVPDATGSLGQKDSGAQTELVQYLTVMGGSSWTGMVGTGQITYGTKDTTAYSATLSILGNSSFRLDAQTASGPLSIRISGQHGTIQEADGKQSPIPANTAATGIFQFLQPLLANIPNISESLLDRGLTTVDEVSLHRVTVELSAVGLDLITGTKGITATDLYFDPASHLLIKSANSIQINGGHGHHFLRVITYGDYRKVGNMMVPFSYTQTLDGQKQWTLQLANVQLNPTFDSASFEF